MAVPAVCKLSPQFKFKITNSRMYHISDILFGGCQLCFASVSYRYHVPRIRSSYRYKHLHSLEYRSFVHFCVAQRSLLEIAYSVMSHYFAVSCVYRYMLVKRWMNMPLHLLFIALQCKRLLCTVDQVS